MPNRDASQPQVSERTMPVTADVADPEGCYTERGDTTTAPAAPRRPWQRSGPGSEPQRHRPQAPWRSPRQDRGLDRPGDAAVGSRTGSAVARGLGVLSAGLGAPLAFAPRAVAHGIGVGGSAVAPTMIRAAGLREIAVTPLLLAGRVEGIWARIGGDLMDLTMLVRGARSGGGDVRRTWIATAAVAGITALDITAAAVAGSGRAAGGGAVPRAIEVRSAVTIGCEPDAAYASWHDVESLPTFMTHLRSVETIGPDRQHWVASGPGGRSVEWDAVVVADVPGERIAWRSEPGAEVPNEGEVRFERAPGGRGTEVRVVLRYEPPAGRAGAIVARIFGEEPAQQVSDDLRRFKQVMETGEVVVSEATPSGVRSTAMPRRKPAAPSEKSAAAAAQLAAAGASPSPAPDTIDLRDRRIAEQPTESTIATSGSDVTPS